MPNWCESFLTVKGPRDEVMSFMNTHSSSTSVFDFNTVVPEPANESCCPSEYHIPNAAVAKQRHLSYDVSDSMRWFDWYSFHNNEWGTKWNACNVSSHMSIDTCSICELRISFDTAWTPCTPIIEKLLTMYPNLDIEYSYLEEGLEFAGEISHDGTNFISVNLSDPDFREWATDKGFYCSDYWEEYDNELLKEDNENE